MRLFLCGSDAARWLGSPTSGEELTICQGLCTHRWLVFSRRTAAPCVSVTVSSMSQSEADKHIQVTIRKHFHWPVATDDIIRQLGRCKNAFNGLDVQARGSSLLSGPYLALRFFNNTSSPARKCHLAYIRQSAGISGKGHRPEDPSKWMNPYSQSKGLSRGFKLKPVSELFHPGVVHKSKLEWKAECSTFS